MAEWPTRLGVSASSKPLAAPPAWSRRCYSRNTFLVAVVAAAGGLAIGALTAPFLTESSAGLVGSAGPAPLTWFTIVLVTSVALGVAVVATSVPSVRAARSSTVSSLADAARPPHRTGWLVAASRRLPAPVMLALRIAARRPRRVALGMLIIAVTVSGMYVLLVLNTFLENQTAAGGYTKDQVETLRHVLLVWTVILLSLAAVNVIVITWATVLDNRHASALARALGATPQEMTTALATAQVLPTLVGALLGIPGGWVLFAGVNAITGGDSDKAAHPVLWQLVAMVLATVLVTAALVAVPARLGGRRPVTNTL